MGGQRKKLFGNSISIALTCAISVAMFLMVACSGDGGGGGSPPPSTPTPATYTMTEFFPLSSGWVTDNYTLFVDLAEHQLENGEITKAMVDTRLPRIMYWTNDDRGLLLHAVTDLENEKYTIIPSAPIKIASDTCKVGDIEQGTVTIQFPGEMAEDLNYSIELLGLENVTTTAGTFEDCLKFQLKAWGSQGSPDLAPAETLWLGKNVGFVKGQHDDLPPGSVSDDTGFELFTDRGETRQLISYHLTPEEEDPEVVAIKNLIIELNKYQEEEDTAAFMAEVDDQYKDRRCRNKQQLEDVFISWFPTITEYKVYETAEDVTLSADGNEAFVIRELFESYLSNDLSTLNKGWDRQLRRFRKTGNTWLIYGSPIEVTPETGGGWAIVWVRKLPDSIGLGVSVGLYDCNTGQLIDSPDRIKSLKVSGPPESSINDFELKPEWYPSSREFFWEFDIENDISNIARGFYTFNLVDQNDDVYVFSRYIGKPIELPIPMNLTATPQAAGVEFTWDPIVHDPEITYYRLEIYDDTGTRIENINTTSNSYFVDTGGAPPVGNYRWRVRARYNDMYNYLVSESRTGMIPLVIE